MAVGKAPVLVIGASPVAKGLFWMTFGIGSGKLGKATRSVISDYAYVSAYA